MEITVYSIVILTCAVLIVSLDLVIILGSRRLSSYVFATFTFVEALWASTIAFQMSVANPAQALTLIKIGNLLGLIISLGFFYFSKVYPENKLYRFSKILF